MSLTTASFWSASELSWLIRASSRRPRRAWTSRLCLSNISSACSRLSSWWRTSTEVDACGWTAAVLSGCAAAELSICAARRRQDTSRRRSSRSDGEYDMYHGTTDDAAHKYLITSSDHHTGHIALDIPHRITSDLTIILTVSFPLQSNGVCLMWSSMAIKRIYGLTTYRTMPSTYCLMGLYSGQSGWAGTRILRNINLILLSSNSSQALPVFPPPRPPSLPLASNTKNPGETAETQRTQEQEPTLDLYSPNSGSYEALGYSLVLTTLTVWPLAGLQQPHGREHE